MRKLIFAFTIILGAQFGAKAQQAAIQSQGFVNPAITNPSLAAIRDDWELGIFTRNQWLAGSSSPNTQFISYSGTTNKPKTRRSMSGRIRMSRYGSFSNGKKTYHAFAFNIANDKAGAFGRTDIQAHWSPQIKLSKKVFAGLGPTLSFVRYQIDPNKIDFMSGSDQTWNGYLMSGINNQGLSFNINGAVIMPNAFVGFSINDPINPVWLRGLNSERLLQRHFGLNFGYDYHINREWDLEAFVSGNYTPKAPLEIDGNIRVCYSDVAWFGLAYRNYAAVASTVGFLAKNKIRFAYTLERSTLKAGSYLGWSHEVYVGILFPKKYKSRF